MLFYFIQSRVSTAFISNHLTQVVQPKLSSSPLQERKIHTMERKVQIAFTIVMMCQATNMDIEPCSNSMWTEGVIRDCYTGHAKKREGLARLSLRVTLEKPYVLASYCPVSTQRVGTGRTLEKFDGLLITKLGDIRSKCKNPHHPI